MKSLTKIACAAIAVAALIPAASMAADSRYQGYLIDASGNIVTSGTGLCWHTSEWTPARAVEPCDPVAKLAAVAPVVVPKAAELVAAAPPAPVAIPVIAPAKPLPQRMSFSADVLFGFDKAELRPEGKLMLDDLARQLNGMTYDLIQTTGHTDRFGRTAYNQRLSERRADSVKNYLIGQNIPAQRIEASGRGETQPLTLVNECRGAKSAKVIACLQPDRRVDVEMTGSR